MTTANVRTPNLNEAAVSRSPSSNSSLFAEPVASLWDAGHALVQHLHRAYTGVLPRVRATHTVLLKDTVGGGCATLSFPRLHQHPRHAQAAPVRSLLGGTLRPHCSWSAGRRLPPQLRQACCKRWQHQRVPQAPVRRLPRRAEAK